MIIKVTKKESGEEKLYEIPIVRLSDFEQWKEEEEINRPLDSLFEEISALTVTEESQEELFVNPIKLFLPRNTLNNLYRDKDRERLNSTQFTKHRKQLLLKVFSEITAEFKPNDVYEVKITS